MPDPRSMQRLAPSPRAGGIFWSAVSWEAAHQALQTIGCAPKELFPLLRGISALYRREIWPPLLLGGVCGRSLISDFL